MHFLGMRTSGNIVLMRTGHSSAMPFPCQGSSPLVIDPPRFAMLTTAPEFRGGNTDVLVWGMQAILS